MTTASTRKLLLATLPILMLAVGMAVSPNLASGGPDRSASVLRDVPGLGRDVEGVLVDDTIAMWEAYQRQIAIADCMEVLGHRYVPVVAYPAQPFVLVADSIEIEPDGTKAPAKQERSNVIASLSATELDSYHMALKGRTTKEVEQSRTSGKHELVVEAGSCEGKVQESSSGLFDLRRRMAATESTERLKRTEATTWACDDPGLKGVSHPRDLEELELEQGSALEAAALECERRFESLSQEVSLLVDEALARTFAEELDAQRVEYQRTLRRARTDAQFQEYLATNLQVEIERAEADLRDQDRE